METFEYKVGARKHIIRYSDVLIEHQVGSKVTQIKPHEIRGIAIFEPTKNVSVFKHVTKLAEFFHKDPYAPKNSFPQSKQQDLSTMSAKSLLVLATNNGMTPDKNQSVVIPTNLRDPISLAIVQKILTRYSSRYLGSLPSKEIIRKLKIKNFALQANGSFVWVIVFIVGMNVIQGIIRHLDL